MKEFFNRCRWQTLAVFMAFNCLIWYAVFREDRHGILTVAFLNVGQGDGIYIEAPDGNQVLLDAGPDKKVLSSLGAVMPFYDRSIDLLALSHPHLDHFGGFFYVVPRYEVGAFLSSGTDYKTPEFTVFKQELTKNNIKDITLHRGEQIDLGGGVRLDVLSPDHDVTNAKPHDGMLVMRLVYGKTSIMLTGDMEAPLEDHLIGLDSKGLKSDLLKIGHHGSDTSTSQNFLGYVSPKYAVISLGAGNKYGHPNQSTLAILDKFGVKTYRTDLNGTVVFKSDGQTLSAE